MAARDVDREIDRLARQQHGVFSHRQALDIGATARIIRGRLAAGRWERLDRHVYALPSHPGTWERQCRGATLAICRAAISHTSAAALHQLSGFRPGTVHVVVPPDSNHRTRLATVHESTWPRRVVVDGIPVVALVDTLYQVAGIAEATRFRSAFADAVVAHRGLLSELFDRHVELAHKRLQGIALVRECLETHDDGATPPASELERLLDRLLDRVEGLPPRRRQAPLPGWDGGMARVDVLIDQWRLIVEADGLRWHTRVSDFERDRWRDNVAMTQGYAVLRFTHHQLTAGIDDSLALLRRFAVTRAVG